MPTFYLSVKFVRLSSTCGVNLVVSVNDKISWHLEVTTLGPLMSCYSLQAKTNDQYDK